MFRQIARPSSIKSTAAIFRTISTGKTAAISPITTKQTPRSTTASKNMSDKRSEPSKRGGHYGGQRGRNSHRSAGSRSTDSPPYGGRPNGRPSSANGASSAPAAAPAAVAAPAAPAAPAANSAAPSALPLRPPHDAAVTAALQAHIDEYFASTKFTMNKAQQVSLRAAVEKVYTRNTPLFCFDVEAWEGNNNLVTEIGISIYDPRDQRLSSLPHIQSYHIIVEETARRMNGQYVPDNKHNFVGGTSHVMPELEAQRFINKMIQQYFGGAGPTPTAAFVGHHIGGDIKWLKTIGVEFPENVPIIDTYKIYQLSHGKSGGGLRQVLRIADIPHAYLHNAGNDAYYTLLAALAWCDPNLRTRKHIDTHVVPEFVPQVPKPRYQIEEDRRAKKQEKFTDIAKRVSVRDSSQLP